MKRAVSKELSYRMWVKKPHAHALQHTATHCNTSQRSKYHIMWVKESFQKSSCMGFSSRIQVSFDVSMWKEKKWEESTKELFPKSSLTGLSSRIQVSFDIYTWKKKNTRWTHRLHCAATPCNTVQCAAIHCFTTQLHRVCGKGKMDIFWNCIYTHAQTLRNTLQHTVTHCNPLQHT